MAVISPATKILAREFLSVKIMFLRLLSIWLFKLSSNGIIRQAVRKTIVLHFVIYKQTYMA
jgi:hypothetical protein